VYRLLVKQEAGIAERILLHHFTKRWRRVRSRPLRISDRCAMQVDLQVRRARAQHGNLQPISRPSTRPAVIRRTRAPSHSDAPAGTLPMCCSVSAPQAPRAPAQMAFALRDFLVLRPGSGRKAPCAPARPEFVELPHVQRLSLCSVVTSAGRSSSWASRICSAPAALVRCANGVCP